MLQRLKDVGPRLAVLAHDEVDVRDLEGLAAVGGADDGRTVPGQPALSEPLALRLKLSHGEPLHGPVDRDHHLIEPQAPHDVLAHLLAPPLPHEVADVQGEVLLDVLCALAHVGRDGIVLGDEGDARDRSPCNGAVLAQRVLVLDGLIKGAVEAVSLALGRVLVGRTREVALVHPLEVHLGEVDGAAPGLAEGLADRRVHGSLVVVDERAHLDPVVSVAATASDGRVAPVHSVQRRGREARQRTGHTPS